MLHALLAAAAGPLGGKVKDKITQQIQSAAGELFDSDGNKVELPPGKTPSRALARAILATADFIEAAGGSEEDRVEAVDGMIQQLIYQPQASDADDDDGFEPPG